ncbi:MAG: hypothetical protein IT576_02120 [Verrucomicrobiales bacterium]|nr:hypothetical protein [Verrucomicrobiales bacterium]
MSGELRALYLPDMRAANYPVPESIALCRSPAGRQGGMDHRWMGASQLRENPAHALMDIEITLQLGTIPVDTILKPDGRVFARLPDMKEFEEITDQLAIFIPCGSRVSRGDLIATINHKIGKN